MNDMFFEGDDLILVGESRSDIGGVKSQDAWAGSRDFWIVHLLNCSITGNCGSITGTVVLDYDVSCVIDVIDIPIAGRMIKAEDSEGNIYYAFTDELGEYLIRVPLGTYVVSIVANSGTVPSAGCIDEYSGVDPAPLSSDHDFFLDPICAGSVSCDLTILNDEPDPSNDPVEGTLRTLCPFDQVRICVTYSNIGTETFQSTEVSLKVSPHVFLPSVLPEIPNCIPAPSTPPAPVSPSLSGRTYKWVLPQNMSPGQSCTFCIETTLDANLNETIVNTVKLKGFCADASITVNASCSDAVTCAVDPNDKKVTPEGCGEFGYISPDTETLTYKVRFQNTGTAAARNIVIRDEIDEDLDIETIAFISSSHPYTKVEIEPGNTLVYSFIGINLPDTSVSYAESQGFVKYQINPKSNLPEGTRITNSASIIFEKNEPVITNTTLNTIKSLPVAVFS